MLPFFFQAVKGSGKMRFNKNELSRLAAQPSHKFEKEGVLFIKEKQEGFFLRKSESKLMSFLVIRIFHVLLYHVYGYMVYDLNPTNCRIYVTFLTFSKYFVLTYYKTF